MSQEKNGLEGNKVGSWDQWAVWVVKTIEVQTKRINRLERMIWGVIVSVGGGAVAVIISIILNHINQ